MEMDVLSVDMNQANVQEQSTEIDALKQQEEALDNPNSAVSVTDPNLGQNVDLSA